jgi:hypothetical protein
MRDDVRRKSATRVPDPPRWRVHARRNRHDIPALCRKAQPIPKENIMGLGRGALLWLLGIPLPIILLLAFFWH